MKIEAGTVTILHISEVPRLDPIRVTLDDIGPGQGRINIECYGKAWASYWGAMGKESIAQFVVTCDNHYLIKNLAPGLDGDKFCGHQLEANACKLVTQMRRKREFAGLSVFKWADGYKAMLAAAPEPQEKP